MPNQNACGSQGTILVGWYGRPGAFPSGLVTFVFTDIEASTQLLRRIGDRYPPLLERHQEILRAAWTAWGGCEVKTDGDSFFVAFSAAMAAIEACAQAQRDLTSEPWPADARDPGADGGSYGPRLAARG